MAASEVWTEVTDVDVLTSLMGEATPAARGKERQALADVDVQWLRASPFCVIATAGDDGSCDASPKGDPAGCLVHVIDERTIAVAERPGNRRVDGYRNVLRNPHVGLLFLVPGRGDTLRVNGRARLVSDAPFFDDLAVRDQRPVLALVVDVDEVFHHCSKAFLRSQLWDPETWDPTRVPRRAVLAQQLERPEETIEQLDAYYDPAAYGKNLY